VPKVPEITAFIEKNSNQPIVVQMNHNSSEINYFDCEKMIEILKSAGNESDAKTIFGNYSSKRLSDWAAIIKAYETDNIFLGEVSHLLLSLANFEM
jgi:hypothetical protein